MGKYVGETDVYAREAGFTQKLAYIAAGNGIGQIEYQGLSYPGTATSSAGWQIKKFIYDSNNRMTDIQWAGGSDAYTSIWDNRAALSYS